MHASNKAHMDGNVNATPPLEEKEKDQKKVGH